MRRIILISVLAVSGCAGPGEAPKVEIDKRYDTKPAPVAALSPEEKTQVQNVVLLKMDKPESANFGFMNAAQGDGGVLNVCGWVNGKNWTSRWKGQMPFYATYEPINRHANLILVAKTPRDAEVVKAQCRDAGVLLSEQPSSI